VHVFIGVADEVKHLVNHPYNDAIAGIAFLVLHAGKVIVTGHTEIKVVTFAVQLDEPVSELLIHQPAEIGI